MLFFQPLARAINLEAGTVDQNVNGLASHILSVVASAGWLPGSGPSAQRGVIGHRQIQSHHIKHRTQKSLALAQPQPKYHAQHQRSFDRQIRVTRLPPLVMRRGAAQPASVSGVIQSVKLPRRLRPASYSAQFVTLNFILPM